MEDNTMPTIPTGGDPVDQYLTALKFTNDYLEKTVPRLSQGIDAVLNSSYGNMIPNGVPKNGTINQALGSNRGIPNFNPGANKPSNLGSTDYVKSVLSASLIPGAVPQTGAINKIRQVGFASGPEQNNFERYYNHPKFKELGFRVNTDNETLYNENSTWQDDMSRAASQWTDLALLGAKQTFTNWDDLFTLNTAGDTKNAREMNKMMSIASSSRGGIGGFAVNQIANSAYTIGVMGSIIAEELALAAATAATEGALGSAAAIKTGQNIKRLFGLSKTLDKTKDSLDAMKLASKTVDNASTGTALNNVQDISQARKFWNGVGNFISPFGQTTEAVKNFRTGANGFDKLTDFAKNAKVFGAFFRDVQLMNTALAESRLEGGFVENENFDKLMAEYYKNNVDPPSADEANKIMKKAKEAGVSTTLANIPAILYSNKIVFDKALQGFRPFRDVGKGPLGTMVTSTVKKGGKKTTFYEGFIDPANPKHWFTKKGLKHLGQQFLPKNLAKGGLRYMQANLVEGLQEVYQEGIAETMKSYYLDTYFGPERAGTATFMRHLGAGMGTQLSGRGAETFLSGFLMGGLVQVPQTIAFKTAPQLVSDFRKRREDPVAFQKSLDDRKAAQEEITNFLNSIADPENARVAYDKIYANIKAQKDFSDLADEAENNGDKKTHEDAKADSLFTHIMNLTERGYADLFIDQVERFKGMKDDELLQAFGKSPQDSEADEYNKTMRERLDTITDKVKEIQKRHDKYSTIQNPFNPKDPIQSIDYIGFEEARKQAIYSEYSWDNQTKRMSSILQKAAKFMPTAESGKITSLFDGNQLQELIDTLEKEVQVYEGGNAEELRIQKEKQALLDDLNSLKGSLNAYGQSYNRAKRGFNKEVVTEVQRDEVISKEAKVGSEVEYTTEKKKKIKGKVIERKGNKVVIEYVDKGRTKTKTVSPNSKSLSVIGVDTSQLELEFDETAPTRFLEEDRKNVESEIRKYIARVAKMDPDDARIAPLVYDLLDYVELADDAKTSMASINKLNDPGFFSYTAKLHSKAMKDALAIAKRKLEESFTEYKNRMATNEIAADLFKKFHVFFDPNEMEGLKNGTKFPTTFYDAATKEEIDQTSGRFKDIMEYLIDFETVNNFDLRGKPIIDETLSQTGGVGRYVKYKDGKGKSLRSIMTDLGLDPKSKEAQTIKTTDLLNYLVVNKFGLAATWRLSQILKDKVAAEDTVTISLNESTAFSYGPEAGIVIDLRYAAADYEEQQLAIEYIVLAPILQKIVADNVSDPGFAKSLDNAMTAVRENYEAIKSTLPADERAIYESLLSSKENFVIGALTLERAQQILEGIAYKTTTKNLWEQLLDDILSFISKIIPVSNEKESVMSEVLGIVSSKVEGVGIAVPAEKGGVDLRPTDIQTAVITVDTPLQDMPAQLQIDLKYAFQEFKKNNPTGVSDSDIGKFVKVDPQAANIIYRYNVDNGLIKAEPGAKPKPAPTTAGTFTPTTPYGTPTGPEVTTAPTAPVSDRKTEIENEIKGLEDQIATTYRFMGDTDSNAAVVQAEKDIKRLEDELKQLKEELSSLEVKPAITTEINFDNMAVGTILRMTDTTKFPLQLGQVVATDPAAKTITVQPTGTDITFVIKEEDMSKEISKIAKTPGVKATAPVEEVVVTQNEVDLSNQNLEVVTSDEDLISQINEDVDAALSSSKEDTDKEFLNSLGCK